MQPVAGLDQLDVDMRRRLRDARAIGRVHDIGLGRDHELEVAQAWIEGTRPHVLVQVVGDKRANLIEIEPQLVGPTIGLDVHREPLRERPRVTLGDDRGHEVLPPGPGLRQALHRRDQARDGIGRIAGAIGPRARARIEHPGLHQARWLSGASRERDLAAEAVARDRVDVAELGHQRRDILRAGRDRVRRRAVLAAPVTAQIDEHHAPLGPPLDELARDAAPVTAAAEDPVHREEPAGGRAVRDRLVVKGCNHAAMIPFAACCAMPVSTSFTSSISPASRTSRAPRSSVRPGSGAAS